MNEIFEFLKEFFALLVFYQNPNVIQANPALLVALGSAVLGGTIGGLGSMFTNRKARKEQSAIRNDITEAQNSQKRLITGQKNDLTDWYNKNYYQDFLDTDVARSTLARLRTQLSDILQSQSTSAVKRGATQESQVASRGNVIKSYIDSISNLAGMGTQWKQGIDDRYQNRLSAINNMLNNYYSNMIGYEYNDLNTSRQMQAMRNQSWMNLAGNIIGAGGALAGTYVK